MHLVMAIIIGGLYATAFYLLLRRSLIRIFIGLIFLSHATNLLIFTAAGLVRAKTPIIPPGDTALLSDAPDPLPQAMILTAIVISFGLLAFSLGLFYRVYSSTGENDLDAIRGE